MTGRRRPPEERRGTASVQQPLIERHRTTAATADETSLTVQTRVGAAATDLGMRADYRWTALDGALTLDLDVTPIGD